MDDQTPGTQPPVTPDPGQGAPQPQEPAAPQTPPAGGDQGQGAPQPQEPAAPQTPPAGGDQGQGAPDQQPGGNVPPAGSPM